MAALGFLAAHFHCNLRTGFIIRLKNIEYRSVVKWGSTKDYIRQDRAERLAYSYNFGKLDIGMI